MKLLDLDPKWVFYQGQRVGFTFFSPVQHPTRIRWRQSCLVRKISSDVQFEVFGDQYVQMCNPDCCWTITGGIEHALFETMTVQPSIDGSAGGLWHGNITSGQIVGGI